jgi:hypothetical protein
VYRPETDKEKENEEKEATYAITTYILVELFYSGDIGRAIGVSINQTQHQLSLFSDTFPYLCT